MTKIIKTTKSRLPFLALAFALSAGTVAGMAGIAAMSEPAMARGNGGGGAAGGDGGGANIMNPGAPNIANPGPVNQRVFPERPNCETPDRITQNRDCGQSPVRARVVNIHGFANCAVVQQVIGANGQPRFVCSRTM